MAAHLETEEINFRMKIKGIIKKYLFFPLFLLVTVSFISCSSSESAPSISEETPAATEATVPAPAPIIAEPPTKSSPPSITAIYSVKSVSNISTPVSEKTPSVEEASALPDENTPVNKSIFVEKSIDLDHFDNYLVRLTATKKIKIVGSPGKAIIWIGNPSYRPNAPTSDDVYAEKNISGMGQWVIVGLKAADFQDINESKCMFIPPTGTEEVFWLYPKQTKNRIYKISAYAKLFTTEECSDSFNQKFSDIVEVEVEIDYEEILIIMLKELWDIFWEKALWFWGALLAIIFTIILRKFKQRFGHKVN